MNLAFDWDRPTRQPAKRRPFVAGKTPQARHASWTGSEYAGVRSGRVLAYIELLKAHGPLSDHEAAARLKRGLSSVNSMRSSLGRAVEPSGEFETTPMGTKRVCWAWRG